MLPDSASHRDHLLFTYGTLRDDDVQLALFDRTCPTVPALLRDWAVFCSPSTGYVFIKPMAAGKVRGLIIRLSAAEIQLADAWEEVPRYRREPLIVESEDGAGLSAWVYTRRRARGRLHLTDESSTNDREAVLASARETRRLVKFMDREPQCSGLRQR